MKASEFKAKFEAGQDLTADLRAATGCLPLWPESGHGRESSSHLSICSHRGQSLPWVRRPETS